MSSIDPARGSASSDGPNGKPPFLNVRNLAILTIAIYSTQTAVPAAVPTIAAGSVSSLLAFLIAVALLDRIIA